MSEKTMKLGSKDDVRSGQIFQQYGPGALVPMPERIVMTAAPCMWSNVRYIHDGRFERALDVEAFGMPDSEQEGASGSGEAGRQRGVDYVSFPDWYFCPRCQEPKEREELKKRHPFRKLGDWWQAWKQKQSDRQKTLEQFMKKPVCPTCGTKLAVARLVAICPHGHMDDFPWVEWAHADRQEGICCAHPHLSICMQGDGSFRNLWIVCEDCGARKNLNGVLGADALKNFACTGRHPWRGEQKESDGACSASLRAILRGASSAYYPFLRSSIVIPSPARTIEDKIRLSDRFQEKLMDAKGFGLLGENLRKAMLHHASDIASDISADEEHVKQILSEMKFDSEGRPEHASEPVYDEVHYREEEYEALAGETEFETEDDRTDFYRERAKGDYSRLPFLRQVVLVHRLREVRAQVGFSRVKPVMSEADEGFVSLRSKTEGVSWYPGYEVRGEGIFLEFDAERIARWEPLGESRAMQLEKNYQGTPYAERRPRHITAKFLLLHAVAHLLIRQLSFSCGYNIASLRERIYCDDGSGKEMSGILIYTASGDADGSLGGLVRQGYEDVLPQIFRNAIDSALFCSNDPVCSLSKGQGRDSLNLAACHACMLLPETSCEEFNSFLDRGVIIGTMEQPDIGFFSEGSAAWKAALKEDVEMAELRVVQHGNEIGDYAAADVWKRLAGKCDNFGDEAGCAKMKELGDAWNASAASLPKGAFGMEFKNPATGETFKADLAFPEQHVLIFIGRASSEQQYAAAKKTGWHCYRTYEAFSAEEMRERLEV